MKSEKHFVTFKDDIKVRRKTAKIDLGRGKENTLIRINNFETNA